MMLRTAKELIGYTIRALDDDVGHVDDFYFDDRYWLIRYLVVDTGGWLSGRKVLLSPLTIGQPDWARRVLPVKLTKEQIENSPDIDLEKPVSRQHEVALHEYYGWVPYWTSMMEPLAAPRPMPIHFGPLVPSPSSASTGPIPQDMIEQQERQKSEYDPHLRSMEEVIGYNILARDGEIGHVETFILDDENWSIMYLVVDTHNWLPGKKVLVALAWVEAVNWPEEQVQIDLERETIKNSPAYNPEDPINRETETVLYDYYGRPVYWNK
ncbi:MAG: PRC-barrel domain-containing protein [Anaerolineae bacterium]|jgi:uncharacterized protein YrrD